jgi:hypothetical protein
MLWCSVKKTGTTLPLHLPLPCISLSRSSSWAREIDPVILKFKLVGLFVILFQRADYVGNSFMKCIKKANADETQRFITVFTSTRHFNLS